MNLRLATRRSPLALIQAQYVRARLAAVGVESTLVPLVTSGDRHRDAALEDIAGRGVFALEVQAALVRGDADVAVHSAKDLPSLTPEGLVLAAVPERRDPADVLVGRSLAGLGPGATVATGSPRRRALLLERRPDLRVVGLRGNMATRLGAAGREGVDAVVAAAAALERLGEAPRIAERLDPAWFTPQVGQGALALEVREDDLVTRALVEALSDPDALAAVLCERAFQRELGVGCTIPAGAYARVEAERVTVAGVMVGIDGSASARATMSGSDPLTLGVQLAVRLRDELGGAALPGWG